ncbi:MAG: 5-(carboxyamino)imidazole ribonucleotide mutase [Clostridia bacterium]|nr:5-(carboxyamino)imidazole ribonucleotide mutase [Clostridia bacterium]
MKKVAIIMGSDSDLKAMQGAMDALKALEIPFAVRILSAHRTPEAAAAFARGARDDGYGVIIAAAGKAAHLAGAMAANTLLPVVGVPMKSSTLDGLDALLSTVQMPSGMPVATVAIDGATNAALLAAQILALSDDALYARFAAYRAAQREKVEEKDRRISEEYSCL